MTLDRIKQLLGELLIANTELAESLTLTTAANAALAEQLKKKNDEPAPQVLAPKSEE